MFWQQCFGNSQCIICVRVWVSSTCQTVVLFHSVGYLTSSDTGSLELEELSLSAPKDNGTN